MSCVASFPPGRGEGAYSGLIRFRSCCRFAFLDFYNSAQATAALIDMRNHKLDGRALTLEVRPFLSFSSLLSLFHLSNLSLLLPLLSRFAVRLPLLRSPLWLGNPDVQHPHHRGGP